MSLSFEEKLEIIKDVITTTTPNYLINQQVDVSVMTRWNNEKIYLRLMGYIWGEYMEPFPVTYLDGWQTFKARHLPGWLLRLFPLRCREVMITPKVVYPVLRASDLADGEMDNLERMKALMVSIIPPEMVDELDGQALEAEALAIKIHLKEFIWGDGQDTKTINYPVNGWQAIKERWAPGWLLGYWPVRYYEKVLLAAVDIYPDIKITLPEEPHRVILHSQEGG